jgi:23S rRNA pseudouridine1911/1915/1917 synthase
MTSRLAPNSSLFPVLYEDALLLVVNKPADLVCHPTKGDAFSSLISRVRLYLGPDGTPQLVHRLDRETSGVILIAKTPATALSLRRVWEKRSVRKEYWAIVHGHVQPDEGLIEAALGKDEQSAVAIKNTVRPDGAPASTAFAVERRFRREGAAFTWLRVYPRTGRKHQIRIHLAYGGHPLVGDKLYGGDENLYLDFVARRLTDAQRARLILPCHALHARAVQFHWEGRDVEFTAEPESGFTAFLHSR